MKRIERQRSEGTCRRVSERERGRQGAATRGSMAANAAGEMHDVSGDDGGGPADQAEVGDAGKSWNGCERWRREEAHRAHQVARRTRRPPTHICTPTSPSSGAASPPDGGRQRRSRGASASTASSLCCCSSSSCRPRAARAEAP
eukprot:1007161-Prymnesium_polylepis.1